MGQSPSGSDISSEKKNNSAEFHQGKLAFGDEIIKHSNRYAINFKKIAEANSILFCVRAPVGELNLTNRVVAIGRGLCSIKPFENILDLRFLYFALIYLKPFIIDKGGGSTFDEITIDIIKKIIIPIPPLREQILIAKKIKGAFELSKAITKNKEYIANITAILKSKILDSIFGKNSSYKSYYEKRLKIKDICKVISSNKKEIKAKDVKEKGDYPVVSQSKNLIDGFSDDKDKLINTYPVVIFGDHTRVVKYVDFNFIAGADGTKILAANKTSSKYLYYSVLYAAGIIDDRGYNRHFSFLKEVDVPLMDKEKEKNMIAIIDGIFKELDLLNAI